MKNHTRQTPLLAAIILFSMLSPFAFLKQVAAQQSPASAPAAHSIQPPIAGHTSIPAVTAAATAAATAAPPASTTTPLDQTSAAEAAQTEASPAAGKTAPAQSIAESDERLAFMSDDLSAAREAPEEGPTSFGLLSRTFGALLLIIGLIVAAGWGMRRFGGARFGAPREGAPELTILSTIGLGDRRSLAVIRFGDRTLLVGSTAQSITLLADETTEFSLAATTAQDAAAAEAAPPARSVADMLKEDSAASFSNELSIAHRRFDYLDGAVAESEGARS